MYKTKKGFTLIELIAVLVIMAIIALIATPLVMNIIRKARIAADKRSIDAYGRSIELAIAGYLLDTGKFPTEVSQLTIEYSGSQVVCSTTQINTDSSVYLSGCTVAGRSVENYTYGSDKSPTYTAYTVGNQVTYNNVNYYVIKDSGAKESTVTLLKAEPLTVAEVNQYGGVGTDDNHVNRYTDGSVGTAYNKNGYGGISYYTSETCKYNNKNNSYVFSGCTTNYSDSEIKHVVDNWAMDKIENDKLKESRLITLNDYKSLCEEVYYINASGDEQMKLEPQYDWLHNSNYSYWTVSAYEDLTGYVWTISEIGMGVEPVGPDIGSMSYKLVVRPVIVLDKSALSS